MPTHKKPIDFTPSKLLTQLGEEIARNANGPILDVACGYGRNAAYIASFGVPVVCIDNDINALAYIKSIPSAENLNTLKLDLINDSWPFKEVSIGAIINVHFFLPLLLDSFTTSLKRGGYLYIETIGGQGENYYDLPPQGFIKTKLLSEFDIVYYKENKVGPELSDAATVKVFAVKRKDRGRCMRK